MKTPDYINDILEVEKNNIERTSFTKRNNSGTRDRSVYCVTLRICLQLLPHLSSEEVLESMFLEIPSKTDFLWLAFLLSQTTPGMDFINVGHHI